MLVHHTGKKTHQITECHHTIVFKDIFFFFNPNPPNPSRVKTFLIRSRKFTLRWRHHVTHPVITWKTGVSSNTTLICDNRERLAGVQFETLVLDVAAVQGAPCACVTKTNSWEDQVGVVFCRIYHGTTANKCKIIARHPKCSRGGHRNFANDAADFKAVARSFRCSLKE